MKDFSSGSVAPTSSNGPPSQLRRISKSEPNGLSPVHETKIRPPASDCARTFVGADGMRGGVVTDASFDGDASPSALNATTRYVNVVYPATPTSRCVVAS